MKRNFLILLVPINLIFCGVSIGQKTHWQFDFSAGINSGFLFTNRFTSDSSNHPNEGIVGTNYKGLYQFKYVPSAGFETSLQCSGYFTDKFFVQAGFTFFNMKEKVMKEADSYSTPEFSNVSSGVTSYNELLIPLLIGLKFNRLKLSAGISCMIAGHSKEKYLRSDGSENTGTTWGYNLSNRSDWVIPTARFSYEFISKRITLYPYILIDNPDGLFLHSGVGLIFN